MSKAEIAVVVMGYICVFFICHSAWMNEPRKGAAEFLGMWMAGALVCWVAQWLLARFILDHGSPNALLWSAVTGFLASVTLYANPAQQVQGTTKSEDDLPSVEIKTNINQRESSSGSVGA